MLGLREVLRKACLGKSRVWRSKIVGRRRLRQQEVSAKRRRRLRGRRRIGGIHSRRAQATRIELKSRSIGIEHQRSIEREGVIVYVPTQQATTAQETRWPDQSAGKTEATKATRVQKQQESLSTRAPATPASAASACSSDSGVYGSREARRRKAVMSKMKNSADSAVASGMRSMIAGNAQHGLGAAATRLGGGRL